MPKNNVAQDSFLTPAQQDSLSHIRDFTQKLEFPPEGFASAAEVMDTTGGSYVLAMGAELAYRRREDKRTVKVFRTEEELLEVRRQQARRYLYGDLQFAAVSHLIAATTGYYRAVGDGAEEVQGLEFGGDMVHTRVQWAGSVLLISWLSLMERSAGLTESPVWERATDAYNRFPRLKPPVYIDPTEGAQQDQLLERARQFRRGVSTGPNQALRSRFKTVNAFRIMKTARQQLKGFDPQVSTHEGMRQMVDHFMFQKPMDLTREEIARAVNTMQRMGHYVLTAAQADKTLATDPNVRFVTFLLGNLRAHDERSERAVFERNVRKVSRQYEKLGISPPTETEA